MSWLVRYRRWIGAGVVCYWLAMFVSTHIPLPPGILPRNSDKLAHFAAYLLLAFSLGLWLSAWRPFGGKTCAAVLAITAVYAAADELLQIPVGRHADWLDGTADVAGAIVGVTALTVMRWAYRSFRAGSVSDRRSADTLDRS